MIKCYFYEKINDFMKKIALSLFFFFFCLYVQAQNKEELLSILKKTKSDTAKVGILRTLLYQYWETNLDSAALFGNQALELSQKAKFKRGIAQSYSDLGNIELKQGNYKKSLSHHQDALKLEEKSKDKKAVSFSYSNLGSVYGAQGKHKEALESFSKVFEIEEQLKQTEAQYKILDKTTQTSTYPPYYDKPLDFYAQRLKLNEEVVNPVTAAINYNNIGEVYRYQQNNEKALLYYEKALAIYEAQKNKQGLAETMQNMARIIYEKKEYEKAEELSLRSLQISKEANYKQGIKNNSELLANIYQNQQNPAKALDHYKSFAIYKDSAQRAENARKIEQQQLDASMTQQKQELDLMRKDAELRVFQSEKRQNELEIAKKEAETEKLLALAKSEKNQRKADSLRQLADRSQLETALLRSKQLKQDADHELRLQKQRVKDDFFWDMIYAFVFIIVGVGVFAYFMYRGRLQALEDKKIIGIEKQRAEELLLNILPVEIAAELKLTGSPPPPRLYKNASVMFTDYSGFTEATERNSMSVVLNDLNECFVGFDRITAKYGIEKIKTIGDAFMCAKGIPSACNAHAVDMVLAGLEMQRFMIDRKKQKEAEGKFCFQCRLGINSGEVTAGIVGERKFCYDIWGNTVNTANRMELSGKVERVNISNDTMELVKDFFELETRDPIQVKGKGIMQLYFALRIKAELSEDTNGIHPNQKFKQLYETKHGLKYNLPI